MNEILEKRLQNPEPKYRGKPFWSWNGDLDEAELHRQIDIMKEMGFLYAFAYGLNNGISWRKMVFAYSFMR